MLTLIELAHMVSTTTQLMGGRIATFLEHSILFSDAVPGVEVKYLQTQ